MLIFWVKKLVGAFFYAFCNYGYFAFPVWYLNQSCKNVPTVPTGWCSFFQASANFWAKHAKNVIGANFIDIYAVLSEIYKCRKTRIFGANFLGKKIGWCFFLRFLQLWVFRISCLVFGAWRLLFGISVCDLILPKKNNDEEGWGRNNHYYLLAEQLWRHHMSSLLLWLPRLTGLCRKIIMQVVPIENKIYAPTVLV